MNRRHPGQRVTMFPSFLVYIGLVVTVIGALSLIRPLRFMRIRSRPAGAAVAGVGLLVMISGFALPTSEKRATVRRTRLDQVMPVWHFDERHTKRVAAPPARVFEAIHDVRAGEILLFRSIVQHSHLLTQCAVLRSNAQQLRYGRAQRIERCRICLARRLVT